MKYLDWVLNAVGLYWFTCIQFDIFPQLRGIVNAVLSRLTFASVGQLILATAIVVVLNSLASAFWDARGV